MVGKDGRTLSFQFHPEYFSEYTISYSVRAESYSADFIQGFALPVESSNIKNHHESCEAIRKCMSLFIR